MQCCRTAAPSSLALPTWTSPPPDQRAILVFTHYLGLSPTEIAERLEIPVGTARSRLHYAHRAMRAAIEADERPVAVAGGRPR